MVRLKTILFDLDNTLYDETQFIKSGYMAVARYLSNKYKLSLRNVYDILWTTFVTSGREKVFDRIIKRLGIDRKEIDKLVEIYRHHLPDIEPYEDTIEILKVLGSEYSIGLITDGIRDTQERKVESLNIKNFFNVIIYTDEYGINKPDPVAYKLALKQLNSLPEETVYVGDNPLKDFEGAKKVGIHTVRILKGEYKYVQVDIKKDADYKIKNLKELIKVISHIEEK